MSENDGIFEHDATSAFVRSRQNVISKGRASGIRPLPPANVLRVSTLAPTNITTTTASSGGNILSLGDSVVTTRGICWDISPNPTTSLATKTVETGTFTVGIYVNNITDLQLGTVYNVRAYVSTNLVTLYGDNVAFTTLTTTPTIIISSATSITDDVATVVANITNTGGLIVTTRGIVWDTNPSPTIALPTKLEETGTFGTGSFSRVLTDLSAQSYYVRSYAINANGISYSADTNVSESLYAFFSHTFTNAGATGRTGPTLSQIQTAYSSASWAQNTTFLNMSVQGIQLWTVPKTGLYRITAYGAQGGAGGVGSNPSTLLIGSGAKMEGIFTLTQGSIVKMLVGQQGLFRQNPCGNRSGSGGGASFVSSSANSPLIVAGGGGGASYYIISQSQVNASIATSGNAGEGLTAPNVGGAGGTNGNGGGAGLGCGSVAYGAPGGGGFLTNGTTITNVANGGTANGGSSFLNNGLGGLGTGIWILNGGFGGGSASGDYSGGGGGGYSGGGGGAITNCSCDGLNSGGGGGSYNIGTSQNNLAGANLGDGSVIIQLIEPLQITTEVASAITSSSAVSGGTVSAFGAGGSFIATRGVIWSTSPEVTVALSTKTTESGTFGLGFFTATMTSLMGNVLYYYAAYAINNAALVGYGSEMSFTTGPGLGTVGNVSATSIAGDSSTITANILNTGGVTVTIRGIVWDLNPNPTTSLATKTEEQGSFSTGTFTGVAINLTAPPYYARAYIINSFGTSYSNNVQLLTSLYTFTTHTFTNASATGRTGPTLSQCRSAYSSASWAQNTIYFNMTAQGYQLWTVPETGQYRVRCAGAGGGSASSFGGRGRIIESVITLNLGDIIKIVVGQTGGVSASSGGGGGTFFATQANVPLVVAGGGAGFLSPLSSAIASSDGSLTTSGQNSFCGTGQGGTNGTGGTGSNNGWGSGGGGFTGNGTAAANVASHGYTGLGTSFVNGATGGDSATSAVGGFGGGAGTHGNTGGGGGAGGYSGGGGSNQNQNPNAGGGGGSYSIASITDIGFNTGQGFIIVTKL